MFAWYRQLQIQLIKRNEFFQKLSRDSRSSLVTTSVSLGQSEMLQDVQQLKRQRRDFMSHGLGPFTFEVFVNSFLVMLRKVSCNYEWQTEHKSQKTKATGNMQLSGNSKCVREDKLLGEFPFHHSGQRLLSTDLLSFLMQHSPAF